jgi:hypothetical protein
MKGSSAGRVRVQICGAVSLRRPVHALGLLSSTNKASIVLQPLNQSAPSLLDPFGLIVQIEGVLLSRRLVIETPGSSSDFNPISLRFIMSAKPGSSVFVGNIAFTISEEELVSIFTSVGRVLKFRLITDKDTGRSKGFGFLDFADPDAADSAIRKILSQTLLHLR